MWLALLQKLGSDFTFSGSVTPSELQIAEGKLGVVFPDQLRDVLQETNGVQGEYGLNLLWPLERIVEDNLRFRNDEDFQSLYMSFSSLLFIGDAGNGDQFAIPIVADGTIPRSDIFAWNHEDDSRSWVAPSLQVFFEWWCNGQIEL